MKILSRVKKGDVTITEYQDPYNPLKIWIVKKYSNSTFTFSQSIKGYAKKH